MSIELGHRLGLVRDAVGLATQAVYQGITALYTLFIGHGKRSLGGKFGQERGMVFS